MTAPVWEFDVAVSTHDLVKAGVTVAAWIRVQVAAYSYDEAHLVAGQMAACHGMPTDALVRI